MAEADDTELLRIARDDATAFDTLIRRHDRFLYRVARSILLDDYEAEDVVQETFIKAFKGLVDFRGEASLSTWLTRIALNEALARKRRHRITVELEALQQPGTQIEPSVRLHKALRSPPLKTRFADFWNGPSMGCPTACAPYL